MSEADDKDTLDVYGGVTSKNKEEMIREIAKTKPEKIELFKSIIDELKKRGIEFWLDAGSLLGAYRAGQMIPHDFDIDLAVLGEENLKRGGEVLHAIKPEGYEVRCGHHLPGVICKKYEIFKIGYECIDPKCVSLDIYQFTHNKKEDYIRTEFFAFGVDTCRYKYDWIFPLGKVMFEGIELPCPNNTEAYLTEQYDYIGPDCYYDKSIQKYRKKVDK